MRKHILKKSYLSENGEGLAEPSREVLQHEDRLSRQIPHPSAEVVAKAARLGRRDWARQKGTKIRLGFFIMRWVQKLSGIPMESLDGDRGFRLTVQRPKKKKSLPPKKVKRKVVKKKKVKKVKSPSTGHQPLIPTPVHAVEDGYLQAPKKIKKVSGVTGVKEPIVKRSSSTLTEAKVVKKNTIAQILQIEGLSETPSDPDVEIWFSDGETQVKAAAHWVDLETDKENPRLFVVVDSRHADHRKYLSALLAYVDQETVSVNIKGHELQSVEVVSNPLHASLGVLEIFMYPVLPTTG